MPFTFSHPAIVLPFKYLSPRMASLTGLVAGSIAPDFEYFFRMGTRSIYSHTWGGLFWFDLPVGLVLAFLFHSIVRDPLFLNFPFLRSRLAAFIGFNWNAHFRAHVPAVLCSVLIGAASHIVWDGFTHRNEIVVNYLPWLTRVVSFRGNPMAIFEILQLFSSIVGGVVIILAILAIPQGRAPQQNISITYWASAMLVAIAVITVKILAGLGHAAQQVLIIATISAGLIGLTVASLVAKKPALK